MDLKCVVDMKIGEKVETVERNLAFRLKSKVTISHRLSNNHSTGTWLDENLKGAEAAIS